MDLSWEHGQELGKGRQVGWQLEHSAPLQLLEYCLPYFTMCVRRDSVRIESMCPRIRLQTLSAGLSDRVYSGCQPRRRRATPSEDFAIFLNKALFEPGEDMCPVVAAAR